MVEHTNSSEPQMASARQGQHHEQVEVNVEQMERQSSLSSANDQIFPDLLQAQKQKYGEFLGDADAYVGEVILERPKRRLAAVEALRDQILYLNAEMRDKQQQILQLINENVYNEETDEGYLEIDANEYQKCYHVDFDGIKTCLEEEVDRVRNELRKAKEDSDGLTKKMEGFLKQNHKMVQDFLKTSHKALYNLAKPLKQRGSLDMEKPTYSDTERSQSEADSATAEPTWEPKLTVLPAVGNEIEKKFKWPTSQDLRTLPLGSMIRLASVELSFTSNLYEIKFNFTGQASSKLLTALSQPSEQRNVVIKIKQRVADLYICMSASNENIYGLRMLNDEGEYLLNENWFESEDSVWKHFHIPDGLEIIGLHGSADDEYIRSLGPILWNPNPNAKNVRQSMGEYLLTK